jgi:hypothetical protein
MKTLSRTDIVILLQSTAVFVLYTFMMMTVLSIVFGPILEHLGNTNPAIGQAAIVAWIGCATFGLLRAVRFWIHRRSLDPNSAYLAYGSMPSGNCAPLPIRLPTKVLRTAGWGITALSILTLPAVFESYVLDRCSVVTITTSVVSVVGYSFLVLCISEFRHRRLLSVGLKVAVALSVVYGCLAVIVGIWRPVMDHGHCKWPWLVLSALIYVGFAYGVRLRTIEVERNKGIKSSEKTQGPYLFVNK